MYSLSLSTVFRRPSSSHACETKDTGHFIEMKNWSSQIDYTLAVLCAVHTGKGTQWKSGMLSSGLDLDYVSPISNQMQHRYT